MNFTQVTKPDNLVQIDKLGTRCLKFTYDSGREWVANEIIWSTSKDRATEDIPTPTTGYVNFSQKGSVSGAGMVGISISPEKPITMDLTVYTNIDTLAAHLVATLI